MWLFKKIGNCHLFLVIKIKHTNEGAVCLIISMLTGLRSRIGKLTSPWHCKNPTERDPVAITTGWSHHFPVRGSPFLSLFFFFFFLPFAVDFLLVWKQSCMHYHCGRSVLTETVVFVKFVVKKFTGEYITLKLIKWWYWLNLNKTTKINHEI